MVYEIVVGGEASYLADYATNKRTAMRIARFLSTTVRDDVLVERSDVRGTLAVYCDGKKVKDTP